jgi:hypothetical protein
LSVGGGGGGAEGRRVDYRRVDQGNSGCDGGSSESNITTAVSTGSGGGGGTASGARGSERKSASKKAAAAAAAKLRHLQDNHPLGGYANRLTCVRGLSQDFPIPEGAPALTVILAVHSHCPLAELVDRCPTPRITVTLPCCGQCGVIADQEPMMSFEDPDIVSPHRTFHVYYTP